MLVQGNGPVRESKALLDCDQLEQQPPAVTVFVGAGDAATDAPEAARAIATAIATTKRVAERVMMTPSVMN